MCWCSEQISAVLPRHSHTHAHTHSSLECCLEADRRPIRVMDRSDEYPNIWREEQTKAVGADPGRPSKRMKEPGEVLSARHTQEQGEGGGGRGRRRRAQARAQVEGLVVGTRTRHHFHYSPFSRAFFAGSVAGEHGVASRRRLTLAAAPPRTDGIWSHDDTNIALKANIQHCTFIYIDGIIISFVSIMMYNG